MPGLKATWRVPLCGLLYNLDLGSGRGPGLLPPTFCPIGMTPRHSAALSSWDFHGLLKDTVFSPTPKLPLEQRHKMDLWPGKSSGGGGGLRPGPVLQLCPARMEDLVYSKAKCNTVCLFVFQIFTTEIFTTERCFQKTPLFPHSFIHSLKTLTSIT